MKTDKATKAAATRKEHKRLAAQMLRLGGRIDPPFLHLRWSRPDNIYAHCKTGTWMRQVWFGPAWCDSWPLGYCQHYGWDRWQLLQGTQ